MATATRPMGADAGTVIIGGGLAGLTTAALLARAGRAVTVVEGAGALGGRARTSEHQGAQLNIGPHALYPSGPGTAVLRDLGIALPGGVPAVHRLRFVEDGRVLSAFESATRLLPVGRALPRLARAAAGGRGPDGAIAAWLDGVAGPTARPTADALARLATYADAMDVQDASVLTEQVRAGSRVLYLHGGWAALVERLRAAAVRDGAVVRTGAAVGSLLADHGAVRGVRLRSGEELRAHAVVLTAGGPAVAADLADGTSAAPSLRDWAQRVTPGRAAALDVVLDSRPQGMTPLALGLDRPLYLSVHSDAARLAPDGGAVVHVVRYLGAGQRGGPPEREELERTLDLAAPDWRGRVVHARYLPAVTVTHDLALTATGGLAGRPRSRVAGLDGLYVAGDWVGPRGYLAQAAISSAADAAAGVLDWTADAPVAA